MFGLPLSLLPGSRSLVDAYNHKSRQIGLVFGYSKSDHVGGSVSVVVRYLISLVDFCAIAGLAGGRRRLLGV